MVIVTCNYFNAIQTKVRNTVAADGIPQQLFESMGMHGIAIINLP